MNRTNLVQHIISPILLFGAVLFGNLSPLADIIALESACLVYVLFPGFSYPSNIKYRSIAKTVVCSDVLLV